jgi:tetratricopeptide (TPR) repeat protein
MRTVGFLLLLLIMSCSSRSMDDIKAEMELAQKNQNVEKQLELYEEIIREFPETKEAVTAEFQMAFIYNNYLQDFDEAEKRYKAFIKKYPNHELVSSAEYEIQTLRISPDELLKIDSTDTEVITK